MDEDRGKQGRQDDEAPLYRDPFEGEGPCAAALSLDPKVRERVTQACPRCGSLRRPWEAPGPCLLDSSEMDQLALDAEALKP